MRIPVPLTPLLVLLLALAPVAARGGETHGWFEQGGQRAVLDHGAAVRFADADSGGQPRLVVLLAQVAPDPERGRGKRNPLGNIEAGLPFDAARLLLYLDESHPQAAIERLESGGLVAVRPGGETLQVENGRVRGEWNVGPDDSRGWQASLRFDLPVIDLGTE